MGRLAALIELSEKERGELEGLSRRRRTAQGLAQRAQIVLLAADGLENKAIAERAGAVENTVGKWRRRFAEKRLDGLLDEPRPGRPREIGDDEIAETVRLTLETTPKGATHWSLRSMADAVDHALSTDPLFVSRRSTSPPDASLENAIAAIAHRSFAASSTRLKRRSQKTSTFISSWTNYATHKTQTIRNWLARRP